MKHLLLACLLLLPALAQADFGPSDIERLCTPEALAATGKNAEYNATQCKRALAPLRTQESQKGDTCTCHALLNAGFELGVTGTIEDIERTGRKCTSGNFSALFADFAKSFPELEGEVFGGLMGAIASKSLNSPEHALSQISKALQEGRLAAISIKPQIVYNDYARKNQVGSPAIEKTAMHALLLRAVFLDQYGQPTDFAVVDSSGPRRLYTVPYAVMEKAYTSHMLSALGRGVYISKRSRN